MSDNFFWQVNVMSIVNHIYETTSFGGTGYGFELKEVTMILCYI